MILAWTGPRRSDEEAALVSENRLVVDKEWTRRVKTQRVEGSLDQVHDRGNLVNLMLKRVLHKMELLDGADHALDQNQK